MPRVSKGVQGVLGLGVQGLLGFIRVLGFGVVQGCFGFLFGTVRGLEGLWNFLMVWGFVFVVVEVCLSTLFDGLPGAF